MADTVSGDVLFQELGRIREQVESNRKESSEGRRRTYDAIGEVKSQINDIALRQDEHNRRLEVMEQRSEDHETAVASVEKMRVQAQAAGWIGKRLLHLGGWLLAGAVLLVSNWERIVAYIKTLLK